MKKFIKLVSLLTLLSPLTSLASCKKQEVKFNFDDKYFIGMQEHYYEVRGMAKSLTNDFIGDLQEAIGSKVFRLNVTMNNLFYVDVNDTVKFNQSTKQTMRKIIDTLTAKGVERIVYATDSFIYPYGYSTTHPICVPDPYSERSAYERWLTVNSTGYGMMAAEFPEIKYFEPINEPDIPGNEVLCKNGMTWGSKQAEFMYSQEDEAHICVDLCYYIRKEIKKVDPANNMMTPALSTLSSTYDYLDNMYKYIESGAHPTGDALACSVNPDDYFDLIDLHPYAFVAANVNDEAPTEGGIYLVGDDYATACKKFYEICCNHGDAEKPHWYTETGFTDRTLTSTAEVAGREMANQLRIIKNDLPFVECVILYKMTDFYAAEYDVDINENNFGLFTSVVDPDRPLEMKPVMKAVYSFMHNGSTDYSAIDAVRAKYAPLYEGLY